MGKPLPPSDGSAHEAGGIFYCQPHCLDEADSTCHAGAGDIQRRAMVHRGTQDGHPCRDGDGALKVQRFGGDVPLVVVEAEDAVVPALRAWWNTESAPMGPTTW